MNLCLTIVFKVQESALSVCVHADVPACVSLYTHRPLAFLKSTEYNGFHHFPNVSSSTCAEHFTHFLFLLRITWRQDIRKCPA